MPTISDTWDDPFESRLKDGTFVSQGDNLIRTIRRATEERFGREHDLDLSDQSNHGRHPQHAARIFPATSSVRPDGVSLDSDDVGKIALISGKLNIWTGSEWVVMKSRYQGNLRIMTSYYPSAPGPLLGSVADWLLDQSWVAGTVQPMTIIGNTGSADYRGGSIRLLVGDEFRVSLMQHHPTGYWVLTTRTFDSSSTVHWFNLFGANAVGSFCVASIQG